MSLTGNAKSLVQPIILMPVNYSQDHQQNQAPSHQEIPVSFADLGISRNDILRNIGYGDQIPDNDIPELVEDILAEAGRLTQPRFYHTFVTGEILPEYAGLMLGGLHFNTGKIISRQLRGSDRYAIFLGTAGNEFEHFMDKFKQEGDMLGLFIADALGTEIAERTADRIEKSINAEVNPHGEKISNRYSPGYCGWDVSAQQQLFQLLPPGICGVKLTDSSLMLPIKSVSGVIGVGKNVIRREYTCNICGYEKCYKRAVREKAAAKKSSSLTHTT